MIDIDGYHDEWDSEIARRFLGNYIVDCASGLKYNPQDPLLRSTAQESAHGLVQRALGEVVCMAGARELHWEEHHDADGLKKLWTTNAPLRNFEGEIGDPYPVEFGIQVVPLLDSRDKFLSRIFNIKGVLPQLVEECRLGSPYSFQETERDQRVLREARPLVDLACYLR